MTNCFCHKNPILLKNSIVSIFMVKKISWKQMQKTNMAAIQEKNRIYVLLIGFLSRIRFIERINKSSIKDAITQKPTAPVSISRDR